MSTEVQPRNTGAYPMMFGRGSHLAGAPALPKNHGMTKTALAPTEYHDEPMTDERALWQSVIVQAFVDACWQEDACKNDRRKHREWRANRSRARVWLLNGSRDFVDVCLLAGAVPEFIRRVAVEVAARGWPAFELPFRDSSYGKTY